MTRMEKKELNNKIKMMRFINLLLIFAAIASVAYACVVDDENDRIKEKISNYNSDSKVYYLKQEIERGEY